MWAQHLWTVPAGSCMEHVVLLSHWLEAFPWIMAAKTTAGAQHYCQLPQMPAVVGMISPTDSCCDVNLATRLACFLCWTRMTMIKGKELLDLQFVGICWAKSTPKGSQSSTVFHPKAVGLRPTPELVHCYPRSLRFCDTHQSPSWRMPSRYHSSH